MPIEHEHLLKSSHGLELDFAEDRQTRPRQRTGSTGAVFSFECNYSNCASRRGTIKAYPEAAQTEAYEQLTSIFDRHIYPRPRCGDD